MRSIWVQYVILGPIIFVWRILVVSLISSGGDGFPQWVFLNSHWSFWCTSHWSFRLFSLSENLSFPLVCFTGNLLRFSFTEFNEIEDPHLPDLPSLIWDHFSGLVSILDVCSEVRHSLSILLLVRSSNLENFLDLGGFVNSTASCFLFKDAISDLYTSLFSSFRYWTACLLPEYFLE